MERIVPQLKKECREDIHHTAVNMHLHLWTYAHQWINKKSVIDAACGTCFGSMIYSTSAGSLLCVDKDMDALKMGSELPFYCPTTMMVADLNKDALPDADVCVSVETIEHLEEGGFFLSQLRTKQLVFTVPINMKGGFHLIDFDTMDSVSEHLNKYGWFIRNGVMMKEHGSGKDAQFMGVAERGK
jgi:hypothetical protein